jgi:hypothetical protein
MTTQVAVGWPARPGESHWQKAGKIPLPIANGLKRQAPQGFDVANWLASSALGPFRRRAGSKSSKNSERSGLCECCEGDRGGLNIRTGDFGLGWLPIPVQKVQEDCRGAAVRPRPPVSALSAVSAAPNATRSSALGQSPRRQYVDARDTLFAPLFASLLLLLFPDGGKDSRSALRHP